MRWLILIGCWAVTLTGFAQGRTELETPNLVPNPGFERFSVYPVGWFYKGEDFTRLVTYWSSPTGASPDVFGPKVRVPKSWAEKGFGDQRPHGGGAFVGLTSYGCTNGKPHCREYVQIGLTEPLVVGQEYEVSAWVARLQRSMEINNLGFYFSEQEIEVAEDELLALPPQIYSRNITEVPVGEWVQIKGRFKARTPANFLILGNFFPDSLTSIKRIRNVSREYAYYYFDDIALQKVPPILPIPVQEDDLRNMEFEAGMTVRLKDLYFDFDRWELHPRSFIELRKLVQVLNQYPRMTIQVNGHTDSVGRENYNTYLSRKRANEVIAWLVDHGIAENRLSYEAYGESMPIATNETAEGRQLNRRVEFVILKM